MTVAAAQRVPRSSLTSAGLDPNDWMEWRSPPSCGALDPEVIETTWSAVAPLLLLADWPAERKVSLVGMEATGVYWKPVYWVLEVSVPEAWVINARHLRNLPGTERPRSRNAPRSPSGFTRSLKTPGSSCRR